MSNRAWVRHWVKISGRDVIADSLRRDEFWADGCVRDGHPDWRGLARWSGEMRGLRVALLLGDFDG